MDPRPDEDREEKAKLLAVCNELSAVLKRHDLVGMFLVSDPVLTVYRLELNSSWTGEMTGDAITLAGTKAVKMEIANMQNVLRVLDAFEQHLEHTAKKLPVLKATVLEAARSQQQFGRS